MDKIVVLGQMVDPNGEGYEMANRVYDKDGISPTIRTYQGGGLEPKVMEVHVRQATTEGVVSCKVGGGSRLKLPGQQDKTRTSNRERRSLPDSDNGEYP